MRILDWSTLDSDARRAALARPQQAARAEVVAQAAAIIEDIRRDGDVAVARATQRFDGAVLESFAVGAAGFATARAALTSAQIAALERAIANVTRFHAAQATAPLSIETSPGVRCERVTRPIESVGLYVPAGSAALPSAVVMLAVPAGLAGCTTRVLCTPPRRDGTANPAVLVAAELCGITDVFRIGGVQAIAAMAFGTAQVPKVHKIFGPGNAWVTAAKQLVASDPAGAACDMPAGPSEVLIVADNSARADFVAADLLAQAEHDPLSQAILVTTSRALATATAAEVDRQMARRSRRAILEKSIAASRLIVVDDLDRALAISNDYAPEHLILQIRDARGCLDRVVNAGSVFLGPWTPESLGDYCSGTNHVLPTYGYARSYSGLSVLDFTRRMTVQEASPEGLRDLGPVAATLAELEELDAHAAAVTVRLDALAGGAAR